MNLQKRYKEKKELIEKRLNDFRKLGKENDERIFAELCFCLLTPQSKATSCWESIETLTKSKNLLIGKEDEICQNLKCRFPNNKARYIVEARNKFIIDGNLRIKDKIDPNNIEKTREWFVKNVKGLGYKEASHFLRNIGYGDNIAILDRHILKNLKKYGVIKEIPKTLTKKKYLEIEDKMRKFSENIKIPISHLDLLFWSEESGFIFK